MRRLAQALIRCYPATWRQRYGEEFAALLEDSPATSASLFDLLKGAIKMQLKVPAFPKLAVMLSFAGLLAGLGVSFLLPPVYLSTAEMRFQPLTRGDSPRTGVDYLLLGENQVLSRTSLSNIIQNPFLDLYKRERAHMPLEDVIEKMRKAISIRIDPLHTTGETIAFRIQFAYPDAFKARQTLQALITGFSSWNLESQRASANALRVQANDETDRTEHRLAAIEQRLGMTTPRPGEAPAPSIRAGGINLDVLDPPSLPAKPNAPRRSAFMLAGFGGGFVLALIIALFRRRAPLLPAPAQTA